MYSSYSSRRASVKRTHGRRRMHRGGIGPAAGEPPRRAADGPGRKQGSEKAARRLGVRRGAAWSAGHGAHCCTAESAGPLPHAAHAVTLRSLHATL
jgi:hypothetical protein